MTDRRLRVLRRGAGGEVGDEAVLQELDATTIEVRLQDRQPDGDTQLLAEALVDLLCRVFPRIKISCSAEARTDERLPPPAEVLSARLERVRQHGVPPQQPGGSDVTVHVGPGDGAADLYADGTGWQAYLGSSPSRLPKDDAGAAAVGPLTAACRAAAWAYLLAIRDLHPEDEPPVGLYWSNLDYTTSTDPQSVPAPAWDPVLEAVLVGAGSIGGAAVYAFARTPELRGELDIVDPQTLVVTNFDRALLATAETSAAEGVKAEVAVAALEHLDLVARPHEMRIDEFVARRSREDVLPLTLCAVDTMRARRSIQDCLPLELINAACDPANSVVSGHRTGSGPCVMCLFMKRIMDREQALFRMIARQTNLNERMIAGMIATRAGLDPHVVRGIEGFRGLPSGALRDYDGRTLRDLWDGELIYGGHRIETESGAVVAVAAPWVTALAGFLLASEALKAGAPSLRGYRLGPWRDQGGCKYEENVYASPQFAMLTQPPRWEGDQCLCNSPRRRRLIIERYGLAPDEYPI